MPMELGENQEAAMQPGKQEVLETIGGWRLLRMHRA